ncbi:MAG: ribonuclease III [Acidobacteriota bacterium]
MSSFIEEAFGYVFHDKELIRTALTHRSYANERGEQGNYERLEFLGDAVLGLVTSRWLYDRYPEAPEGRLAKRKSFLVSSPVLAEYANRVELGNEIRLGVGESRSGGSAKTSILADAVEAIFGAIYLDGGLSAVREVIEKFLADMLATQPQLRYADAKTQLQEVAQARGWGLPSYRIADETGPDHQKRFKVECLVDGTLCGMAEGTSKKAAEQAAAAVVLERLDLPEDAS